jgi:hypothetical protein
VMTANDVVAVGEADTFGRVRGTRYAGENEHGERGGNLESCMQS